MSGSTVKKPATTKKTTRATAGKSTSTAKAKTAPKPAPAVVPKPEAVVMGPVMRKKELIEKVVARSGIKKKDAKPVVEAMLSVLGDALAEHRELALQPMGKVKIKRARNLPNGRMMVARIRQSEPSVETGLNKTLPDAAE